MSSEQRTASASLSSYCGLESGGWGNKAKGRFESRFPRNRISKSLTAFLTCVSLVRRVGTTTMVVKRVGMPLEKSSFGSFLGGSSDVTTVLVTITAHSATAKSTNNMGQTAGGRGFSSESVPAISASATTSMDTK